MRPRGLKVCGAVAAIAAGSGLPANATVLLQGANVFTDAGSISFPSYPGQANSTNFATNQDSLATAPGVIDAAASEVLTDSFGNRGYDQEDTLANLTSTANGTVDFSGGSSALDVSPTGLVQSSNSGSSFNFDFQLTSGYILSVHYTTVETDGVDPASYLQVIDTTALGPPIFALNPADNSDGGFSLALGPGSYELGITSRLGDTSDAVGPGLDLGLHLEQYNFSLTSAAPEPATWTLMFVGLASVGLYLRRARSKASMA